MSQVFDWQAVVQFRKEDLKLVKLNSDLIRFFTNTLTH